jgi:hypothetical protein
LGISLQVHRGFGGTVGKDWKGPVKAPVAGASLVFDSAKKPRQTQQILAKEVYENASAGRSQAVLAARDGKPPIGAGRQQPTIRDVRRTAIGKDGADVQT